MEGGAAQEGFASKLPSSMKRPPLSPPPPPSLSPPEWNGIAKVRLLDDAVSQRRRRAAASVGRGGREEGRKGRGTATGLELLEEGKEY